MELTLDNLIGLIADDFGMDKNEMNEFTNISDYTDGYPAEDLLDKIQEEFDISFNNFDIKKYFHSELEITKSISLLNLLRLRKFREVNKLTIGELYEYMKKNRR